MAVPGARVWGSVETEGEMRQGRGRMKHRECYRMLLVVPAPQEGSVGKCGDRGKMRQGKDDAVCVWQCFLKFT